MDKTKTVTGKKTNKGLIKGAQRSLKRNLQGDPAKEAVHRFTPDRGTDFYAGTNINAAEAKEILKADCNKDNRDIKPSHLKSLCCAARSGQWILAPSPLVFGYSLDELRNDDILDGGHRLTMLATIGKEKLAAGEIEDLKDYWLPFRILCGQSKSVQDKIDKNATRSLTDTAVLSGAIGKRDAVGKRALKLCFTSLCKTKSGERLDKGLATHEHAINILGVPFADTGQTHEEFARELQEIWDRQNRSAPCYLGHVSAIHEYARYFPNKAKFFFRLISGNTQEERNLDKEGFDIDENTDSNSIVYRFKDLLRERKEKRLSRSSKVEGGSHGGSVFPLHFSEMLYVIQQFHNKTGATKMSYRSLVLKEEIKGNKSKFNFHWGMLKAEPNSEVE
jgi:hypothetical protein|tara:strand:- start:961 stop:2133 length:1173 start_codon:yes stop_codon:yes gene_type:complete